MGMGGGGDVEPEKCGLWAHLHKLGHMWCIFNLSADREDKNLLTCLFTFRMCSPGEDVQDSETKGDMKK
jgi:hypothetical protein